MLSLRYIFRLITTFIVRFRVLLVMGAFLGIIIFFLLRFFGPLIFGKYRERIGLTGRYRVDTLPTEILNQTSEGLTKLDESGMPQPALADRWETPDKGKTWIFHLKDGKYWQDGKKVTASSIVYQFSDAKIEKPDAKTIVFKLESPFSPFPVVVSQPTFKKGLLGVGEWKVTKISLAGNFVQEMVLVNKNKDKKVYKFYPTEERAKLAYKLGQVDKITGIFTPKPFLTWKTARVEKNLNKNNFVAIFFNVQDKTLSEKSLRQALSYAIDKDAFDGPRALGPISPNSWAYNPQVKPYTYDPDRARQLINDLPKEVKANLEIKLVTTPILLSSAEKVAKFWEAIGIKTAVQVSSGVPSDYQALMAIFDTPSDPDQYAVWHSTQLGTNISHYKNDRIDKLLEDGRLELNTDKRVKIYLDFQRFLIEDSPAAFLYHPITYTVSRK